jgi:hypothetical protein
MTLADVGCFAVPAEVVSKTEWHLRRAGERGLELFVLWSGLLEGNRLTIHTAHVPHQTSYQLEGGLMVRVDGEALHALNAWLYQHHEILAAQVHAHPTLAFHSNTDDTFPIVTAEGGVSIVAADFCQDGLLADTTVTYRLRNRLWLEVPRPADLLQVI